MTLEGNIKSMAKDSNFSNLYSKTNLAYVKNEIERLDNVREIASLSF